MTDLPPLTENDLKPADLTHADHLELLRQLRQARDWACQLEAELAERGEL